MNHPRIAAGLTAAALTLAVGCSSDGETKSAAPPPAAAAASTPTAQASASAAEPRTEAAVRAAASEEFDSYASGDYGATWDLYYAPAKKAISRADYQRLFKLCPDPAAGVRFQIEKVTMDSDREAHVRVSRLGLAVASYQFVYESGHWRFVPTDEAMRDYRTKSVMQMTSERRAQGGCGS